MLTATVLGWTVPVQSLRHLPCTTLDWDSNPGPFLHLLAASDLHLIGGFDAYAPSHALHSRKINLKIIPGVDSSPPQVGFPEASVRPATVCSKPKVNGSGVLPFTPLR